MESWESNWADYYKALGLEFGASDAEIRDAYNQKAQSLSPGQIAALGRRAGRRAEQELRRVNQAYEVLRIRVQRQRYDAAFEARSRGETPRAAAPTSSLSTAPGPARTQARPSSRRLAFIGGAVAALVLISAGVWLLARGGGGHASSGTAAANVAATPTAVTAGVDEGTPLSGAAAGVTDSCGAANPGSKLATVKRSGQRAFAAPPQRMIDPNKGYAAVIQTSKGEVRLELAAKDVPNTTNNFVFLACDGYYDGLNFHRVEPGFVIQGGDPLANGSGGPGYSIPLETSANWKHITGALAMARSNDPNSAGSQFYITLAPQTGLDEKYAVFGKVTSGMDVVQQIRVGDKIVRIDIIEQ